MIEDRLQQVRESVPRSADEDAMFEGRIPWNLETEIRTVMECVVEELRSPIQSLESVSRATTISLRRKSRHGGQ